MFPSIVRGEMNSAGRDNRVEWRRAESSRATAAFVVPGCAVCCCSVRRSADRRRMTILVLSLPRGCNQSETGSVPLSHPQEDGGGQGYVGQEPRDQKVISGPEAG